MSSTRANQISDLYQRAAALPETEREAFLRNECRRDEALRQEVESLLQFAPTSSGFLERPALAHVAALSSATSVGRTLGAYTLTERIGAGGMGEVYRARDRKLERDVAIKILPQHFTDDPERHARFAREARVLATLNHPNIGAIYGLEEADGVTGLVLELVEGQTLAERLEAGALTIAEALNVVRQIAEALAAAHDKGIIHRDLKPSNIVLQGASGATSSDLRVKVLDFGLAKSLATQATAATQAESDSFSTSTEGRLLGTPAYMSPEQARGVTIDKRTDIWAFGCVLFELITGKRAFDGDTITDTLARVLEREPDWSLLPADMPSPVQTLLRRCLRKDPHKRLHDVSDALIELEEATAGGPAQSVVTLSRQRQLALAAVVVASVLLGATGALLWNRPEPAPEPRGVKRIPIDSSTAPLIRDREVASQSEGDERPFALSHDGRYLVYVGRTAPNAAPQLILRAVDQLTPTALAGTTHARSPFFSPDGQWIGYWSPEGAWKKVSRTGGTSSTLWRSSSLSRGGAWLPDNTIIVAALMPASGLVQLFADGGEPKVLTRPAPGEQGHYDPVALPGGRGVLFMVVHRDNVEADLLVLDLATGRTKLLIKGGGNAAYVDPGYLVYAVPGAVRAQRFDLERLDVVGESVTLIDGVRSSREGWEASFATSRNGTLVYAAGASPATAQRSIVWVDRAGRERPFGAPSRAYAHPRLSHDDSKLAIASRDQTADIWLWDVTRPTALVKLTSGPASDINPVWLPGDRELLLASRDETAVSRVTRVRADGSGGTTPITSGRDNFWPISVTPDGAKTVAVMLPDLAPMQLATVSLDGSGRIERLLGGAYRVINGELSPNGQWLAYQSNETEREEIYVSPFPDVAAAKIPIGAGIQPAWCRTGEQLFYLDNDGYLTQVSFDGGSSRAGTPRRVLDRRYGGQGLGRDFDVSRDCQRFVMFKDEGNTPTDTPLRLVLLLDWIDWLKRQLPF